MLFKSNFVLALMLVLCCCCFVSVGGRRGRGKVTKIEEFADADSASDINEEEREGKLFPIFNIVRFPNDACTGSGTKNGTCYTAEDCASKGGVSGGNCAAGFGICCLFDKNCGATSNENCTYFESTGTETAGDCRLKICRCNTNICQLRLDFSSFVITGPSTATVSSVKLFSGLPSNSVGGAGVSAAEATQCLTDTFSVTNPGGNSPPQICGTNTNQHMYVDASAACNDLIFQLGATANGATIPTRMWSIKVTQYDCEFNNLAPKGCTQYFFGSNSQQVQTYNFDGGIHLANQNQNICVRTERGNCKICWTAAAVSDVQLSGTSSAGALTTQSACCGYGSSGSLTQGYDCLTIPGAITVGPMTMNGPSRICGRSGGLVSTFAGPSSSVCSTRTPFNIRFLSDMYEFTMDATFEAAQSDAGFRLTFIQNANNC